MNFTWDSFISRMQNVIGEYGKWHMTEWRNEIKWAKRTVQQLIEFSQSSPLSDSEKDYLSRAQSKLTANDKRKLHKWQTRARMKPLMDLVFMSSLGF